MSSWTRSSSRNTRCPGIPYVRRAVQVIAKSTIDNADATYFSMPIDGNARYWIRGRTADFRHWRVAARAAEGRHAPQYLIFECASGFTGDSGSLRELAPGTKAMTGLLDVSKLALAPDGSFEILCAPERPAGFDGNFLRTRIERQGRTYVGASVSGRQLFYDWEREDPVEFWVTREGAEHEAPAAYTPAGRCLKTGRFAQGAHEVAS